MNIRRAVLAALLISAVMLCGCKGFESISTSLTVQNTEPASEKTETVQSTEPDMKYKPASIIKNAVRELECSKKPHFSSIRALGGSRLLAVSEYNEDEYLKTVLQVIDTAADNVAAQREFEGSIVGSDISVTDRGIAVYIEAEKNFVFFDEKLEEKEKFKSGDGGVFSRDGKKYYITISGNVFETDVENGNIELVKSSGGIAMDSMSGLSVGEKYAVIQGDVIDENENVPHAVVDITDGSLKMLADDIGVPICGKNNLFITKPDDSDNHLKYYFVNKNGCYEYEPENNESFCNMVDNSDMVFFNDDTDPGVIDLYNFSGSGTVETAAVDLHTEDIGAVCRLNNGNIVFTGQKSDNTVINVIDMSKVNFSGRVMSKKVYSLLTVDNEIKKQYAEQTKEEWEFTSMTQLKAYADVLEDEYNVNFFISDECGDHDIFKEYNPTSTEYDPATEIEMISSAFKQLKDSFEKYPDDFFGQFTDFDGNNGINIYLVGHIKDEFSAAYTFFDYDYGYYNMVFDISYDLTSNFPHEMWHSTENFICNYDADIISDEEWSGFNPEEFAYIWEYEGYEDLDNSYTYCASPEECYFIDEYAKVDPKEDRARIMEYVMNSDDREFLSSGHIRDKLDYMREIIREAFDTESWDDVYWEKYHAA